MSPCHRQPLLRFNTVAMWSLPCLTGETCTNPRSAFLFLSLRRPSSCAFQMVSPAYLQSVTSKRTRWLRPDDLDVYYTLERLVFFTPSEAGPQQNRPRCQKGRNEISVRTGWWPVAVTTALPVRGEINRVRVRASACLCELTLVRACDTEARASGCRLPR